MMTKQIMLVDDETGILALLGILFKRNGFTVTQATDGFTALDLLESSKPDLMILDVMMPGMDGIELCRRIRARPETSETPIIMLSAKTDPKTIKTGLEAGANDYMAKPALHQELLGKVRQLLNS